MTLARRTRRGALLSLAALLLLLTFQAAPAFAQDEPAVREMDELMSKAYPPNEPGAAVIVVKNGKTLLRKGYGLADVELGVKVEPDMVFRLGSITKQFTAASILLLAEQGKLSLSDDMTKFFPDYPAKGRVVTVEHLLTHTSGIKSYTSIPAWHKLLRNDMAVAEVIDLFKNEPPDFAPGEQWAYNNSGYFLLGAIIEKVSGMTYEQFLQKNIFGPLGMTHTFYGSAARVIPRRVPGYTMSKEGLENSDYISMTQPYAAGSLLSTVDDLALWDASLYTEKLLKRASLQRAWTPYVLKDGTPTGYGFGWAEWQYEGRTVIEHGGGIQGFTTDGIRLPEDRVYVAVLTNRDYSSPDPVAFKLAALAAGKPLRPSVAVQLKPEEMDALVGVYQINERETYTVRRDGTKLTIQRNAGRQNEIFPLSPTVFFYEPEGLDRLTFAKDAAGKVTGLKVTRRIGPPTSAARTDKPLPKEREAVKLTPEVLERYVGVYELRPGFSIAVTRRGDQLFTQATGQPEYEIFAASEKLFFVRAFDAQLEFQTDAEGRATGVILHQGGGDTPAKKVK
ncbi:MAG: serine hydrolase [Acidobacteria bacterium]|nr:serine hydrolase [Acidobacteriota bacterium]